MIWPATIACAVLGLAIAHIPGGLLGLLIGSIIDRNLALTSWAQLRTGLWFKATSALDAQQVLFMLLGHLAKSTGRVTPEHIQAARLEIQRLQLSGARQKTAIAAFSQGKECRLGDLHSSLRAHYSAHGYPERLLLAGWRMALAQGLPTAKQCRILQQCADVLGCSAETFARIEVQSMRGRMAPRMVVNELDSALQLLGVSRSASLAQVKKSYRRQVSLHHPDKLIGAGAKPAQVQAATEKTRALHHAYAVARKYLQR
jgi:DnaJ like chaperone protein